MRPILRLFVAAFTFIGAAGTGLHASGDVPPPLALRGTNPRWLSGGLYSALASEGRFGGIESRVRAHADGVADLSKGKPPAVLDARVGVNVRLGDDPSALPGTQRGQAEPHIARSVANPNLLLATFQEGRFAMGGGSIDCGYAVSSTGGLTWTRSLIPQLTTASGGTYRRATDPVAGIGPQGDLYLATIGSLVDDSFGTADIVVSRSTDGGGNWTTPTVAFHQTTAQAAPDKEWLAVNDYSATASAGRLVITWTNFTATAAGVSTGNNLLAAISDDRGTTWSTPITITPTGALNQGSQPLFLPDGSLAVIYVTFPNLATSINFSIHCKRSTDGGLTFPVAATTAVPLVNGFDDPDLRNGLFLPSAAVARSTGEIFVTYVAAVSGTPRVMVTKSSDKGDTWTAPVIASDNPTGVAVDNPAIAVTPDGQTVSVVFIDKRNSPVTTDGHAFFIDHYASQSFDGGATWQPNLRLSELTSDIRYAALTAQGYMLGDYLGLAPSLIPDQIGGRQPCVAIWCDTRTGDADPFAVRFQPAVRSDYAAWCTVRGVFQAEAASDLSDGDGVTNFIEFFDGTDPRHVDVGEALFLRHPDSSTLDVAWAQRTDSPSPLSPAALSLLPGPDFSKIPIGRGTLSGQLLTADQLPQVPLRAGLVWRGIRASINAREMYGIVRSFITTLGQTTLTQGEPIIVIGTDSRLTNLSTRGPIRPGGGPMIAGFVTRGSGRNLLIRGVGPSLAQFGITDFAADPAVVLVAEDGRTIGQNDNWLEVTLPAQTFIFSFQQQVGAFPLPRNNSRDAAFNSGGPAGAYTAQVRNVAAAGGSTALIEIYDGSPDSNGLLVNLSTRGEVGPPDGALIAGFALRGTQPHRMLVRAVGPSLTQFGVTGCLVDPVLTLYDSTGKIIATNDDWEISRSAAAITATAQYVGAFALNSASLDAALLVTLSPGNYTAVVTGANGAIGTALVEVYDAN